jgi:hypothetical protein
VVAAGGGRLWGAGEEDPPPPPGRGAGEGGGWLGLRGSRLGLPHSLPYRHNWFNTDINSIIAGNI